MFIVSNLVLYILEIVSLILDYCCTSVAGFVTSYRVNYHILVSVIDMSSNCLVNGSMDCWSVVHDVQ